jgi:thiamine-phosphate pyrophosphorylase
MYKIIAITNRHICNGDFINKIDDITAGDLYALILREKDLSENEYEVLAEKVLDICNKNNKKCIFHTYIDVAERLGNRRIHLTMEDLRKNADRLKNFDVVGASTHSVEEAKEAEKLGATYITASHIYATDCKKGLEPRGTDFLKEVCLAVDIPVFALGGINAENIEDCVKVGAEGGCMMSAFMR